ncbi:unnamed protein product [Parnassius mnemosyne]|uniref:Uncharacterized protein n=1 Tax=Parnassius mnemosyne TaxID=213953 RepID=A0AAV1KU32_9NEOP
MSHQILLFTAALAIITLVTAMPSHLHHHHPRTVDLADALNRTVCPIVVEVDDDPARVPRRIKMMKCAPDPNKWCMQQKIPQHECCEHNHNNHQMECVEMHDTVLVQYPAAGSTRTFDVAVGCSCMVGQSSRATTVPSGPT